MKIPFAKPHFTEEDIDEITLNIKTILRSGWLTSGPYVDLFEKQFKQLMRCKYAVAMNSCTACLHSILLALRIGPGHEVIVPTNTFVATANAALYVGAKPVFVDSDPETFNINPDDIAEKINRNTKVIIPVHLAGNPCNMDEIVKMAKDEGVYLVEDCAHALGATFKGKLCGTFGIAGAFSFYPTKVITTAEGGIVITNSLRLSEQLRSIRNHGRASFGAVDAKYLGFNYRMSDVHAVIGLSQLKHLEQFLEERNRIANIYSRKLSKLGWLIPQKVLPNSKCSYYAYIVRVVRDAPITRDKLVAALQERGIGCSIIYTPIHLQSYYKARFRYRKGTLPVAEELGETTCALPMFNGLSEDQIDEIVEVIQMVAK